MLLSNKFLNLIKKTIFLPTLLVAEIPFADNTLIFFAQPT